MMSIAAMCLALNMYHEARDQGHDGMVMVAEVTMNRVEDDRWPSSVCGVVWDDRQFSWTHDDLPDDPDLSTHHDRVAWALAQHIAEQVMAGDLEFLNTGATHYHTREVSPFWMNDDRLERIGLVGDHVFYIHN